MKIEEIKLPTTIKITSRTSSITNAFINGIIPSIKPSPELIAKALSILEMDSNDVRCAYCGDEAIQFDHFEPIVMDQRPRGFITEIYNLMPCCSTCNSSKSGSNWYEWIMGFSPKSPRGRNKSDIENRIMKIKKYEEWCKQYVTEIDIEKIIGKEDWDLHWKNHDELLEMMKEMQDHSDKIKQKIQEEVNRLILGKL